jgi:hypothetical protein
MEILEQLNQGLESRVNLNATNLSSEGKHLITGFGMPSSKYDELAVGANGATYVAPANGWVNFACLGGISMQLYNNSCTGFFSSVTSHTNNALGIFLPVKKGDIFQIYYNITTHRWFRFYYAEGDA